MPVSAYRVDENGKEIRDREHQITTASTWYLKRGAAGVAEMSVMISDVADLPEGNLVIDPEMMFNVWNTYTQDAMINRISPNTNYGGQSYLSIEAIGNTWCYSLLGFGIPSLPANVNIKSASLRLYAYATYENPTGIATSARVYMVTSEWSESFVTWNSHSQAYNERGFYGTAYEITSTGYMNFDVTQPFKAHIASSTADIHDKGFLIKYTDNYSSKYTDFYSKDGGAAPPELHVKYEATKFGSHFPKTLTDMANDKIYLERYYGSNRYTSSIQSDFVSHWNHNNNNPNSKVKVMLNLHCGKISDSVDFAYKWWEVYESPVPSAANVVPASYGHFVKKRLEDIESALKDNNASANLSDVIFAVEIGNEEEAGYKWGTGNGYQEGKNFAEYYVEAQDVIRVNWPQLEIISGGSVENTRELGNSSGVAYKFIEGFIDQVKTSGSNTYELFPDTIAIHGYSADKAPEYYPSSPLTEWFSRLQELYTICNNKGWLPNFALTEYGWSATHVDASNHVNIWGFRTPAGNFSSATSQAMFYAREVLMNACMRPFNGIGWKYDFSYHHTIANPWKTYDSSISKYIVHDFGFFEKDTNPPQSRIIRTVARELFDPAQTPSLSLSNANNLVVLPTKAEAQGDSRIAYCAWKVNTGASSWQNWGAIWEYKWNEPYSNITASTKTFEIPGDYSSKDVDLYKFNASFSDIEYQDTLDHTNQNEIKLFSNPTRTQIYVPIVDENPTFIKLN